MKRGFAVAALVVAMMTFGVGVYHAAGYLRAGLPRVQRPNQVSGPSLPGTVYVTQAGAIYRYRHGSFTQITAEAGWMQPAAAPNGNQLIAVKRQTNYSDLYLLERTGRGMVQLTHDRSSTVEANHWAFYPRFSPDGSHFFYDFDPKDPYNSYRVDLAVYASPADPASDRSTQWSYPNQYTGGDVNPVPLSAGGLIYTKFSIDDQSIVHSQIWYQARAGSAGVPLTDAAADCLQAAISPNEAFLAFVCTNGDSQTARLVVSSFYRATLSLGPPTMLANGRLVASPTFSPDGRTIAYLAPATAGGGFQLWTVPATQSTAAAPKEITSDLALDASSAPVWLP